ncbi:MAG: DNA adenine methylase, partial [Anaerolineae bacterium]|nr:DNA adenine methylase [Anaerolineae bacterium]
GRWSFAVGDDFPLNTPGSNPLLDCDYRFGPGGFPLSTVADWSDAVQFCMVVTNCELLADGDKKVFTFFDPPYFKATKSRLYGKNGVLHTGFNHDEFADEMKKCKHSWLITYDDSPKIRANFSFAKIYEWELQYGMNNYKQGKAEKGSELFISNYDLPKLSKSSNTKEETSVQLVLL